MLSRIRDLAVRFNNETLSASDKTAITAEVAQLCAQVAQIGSDVTFNGIALLTGNATMRIASWTTTTRCSLPRWAGT